MAPQSAIRLCRVLGLSALSLAVHVCAFAQNPKAAPPTGGSVKTQVHIDGKTNTFEIKIEGAAAGELQGGNLGGKKAAAAPAEMVGMPLTVFKGHYAAVHTTVFSPNGMLIASVGAPPENWIRLWDASTGKQLGVLKGHTFWVQNLVFSPDGKQLVSASHDGSLRGWDVEAGKELFRFLDHAAGFTTTAACYSPDGKYILTGGILGDSRFFLLDAANGREIRRVKGNSERAFSMSLAFSRDGKRILSANTDLTVTLIDFEREVCLQTFKGAGEMNRGCHFETAVFSPDDKIVAAGGGSESTLGEAQVRIWDVASGQELHSFPGVKGKVETLEFSPDGKRLVTGGTDRTLRVWDIKSGRELWSVKADFLPKMASASVRRASFSPDGKRILTCGGDRLVKIWDASRPAVVSYPIALEKLLGITPTPKPIAPPSGRRKNNRFKHDFKCLALSPDGKRLATGTEDGEIKLWDVASGREMRLLQPHKEGYYYMSIDQIAFSPDGNRIVSCSDDRLIKLWDASSGRLLRMFDDQPGTMIQKSRILAVGFSPEGKRIFGGTTSPDDKIRIWDAETGELRSTLKITHPENSMGAYTALTFNRSMDSFVASGAFVSYLYDATTATPIRALEGLSAGWTNVTASPDGRKVIDINIREVSIVELATGKRIQKADATKNDGFRSHAVFSPDGKTFAVGGFMGSLTIYAAATGEQLIRNFDDIGPITALAYSPDGRFIITGSAYRSPEMTHREAVPLRQPQIQLWNASTGEVVRTFEPRPLGE